MKIIRYREAEAKNYPSKVAKGATGRVVIGKADGAPNFCMRVFEIAEGGYTSNHGHGYEHEVFVHCGEGAILKGGEWAPFSTGSVIFISPNEEHQLKNTGKDPLVFVCLVPSGAPEL